MKIGHGGTLDPMATGVLPICVGVATRFSRYLLDGDKTYLATVTFGSATDTYDADGEVVASADPSALSISDVERAVARYVGEIEQVPPIYSAIKVGGRRMYQVARSGGVEPLPSRRVKVDSIDILAWTLPDLVVAIMCGKGFYVRSFAHDLGADLGCGAHLSGLRRTRAGSFTEGESAVLDVLVELARDDEWVGILRPVDSVLGHLPRVDLGSDDAADFCNGMKVKSASGLPDGDVRVYSHCDRFLGVGRCFGATGAVAPSVVIASR